MRRRHRVAWHHRCAVDFGKRERVALGVGIVGEEGEIGAGVLVQGETVGKRDRRIVDTEDCERDRRGVGRAVAVLDRVGELLHGTLAGTEVLHPRAGHILHREIGEGHRAEQTQGVDRNEPDDVARIGVVIVRRPVDGHPAVVFARRLCVVVRYRRVVDRRDGVVGACRGTGGVAVCLFRRRGGDREGKRTVPIGGRGHSEGREIDRVGVLDHPVAAIGRAEVERRAGREAREREREALRSVGIGERRRKIHRHQLVFETVGSCGDVGDHEVDFASAIFLVVDRYDAAIGELSDEVPSVITITGLVSGCPAVDLGLAAHRIAISVKALGKNT